LIGYGILEAFISKLDSDDIKTITVILEAINNILKCGKEHFMQDGNNLFTLKLESMGAVDKIE